MQRESANFRQEPPRPGLHAHLPQCVATVVICHRAIETSADIVHLRHFQKKFRKFPNARFHAMNFREQGGIVRENLRIMMRNHRRAGAGRNHNIVGVAKDLEKVPRDSARFLPITAIKRRLATAGLGLRKIHGVSDSFENIRDGKTYTGKNLIDNAGCKKSNAASGHETQLYRAARSPGPNYCFSLSFMSLEAAQNSARLLASYPVDGRLNESWRRRTSDKKNWKRTQPLKFQKTNPI